jgi:hypothetical protein
LLPFDDRIDGGSGLAVVLSEQVRVYSQGNVRLGVPQAFADGHDIHAGINELARMRVAAGNGT